MLDIGDEIRKALSMRLKNIGLTVNYYGSIKEQGFETPCIMIAPIGDSGSKVNYELDNYQHRKLGFQILFFPDERTVLNDKTISSRVACLTVLEEILNMRYIGDVALIHNPSYTIQNDTLSIIFYTRVRGKYVEEPGIRMQTLEENGGLSHG